MKKYAKYVNAILFIGAVSVFWVSKHYLNVIIGYFQLSRKIGSNVDFVEYGSALALGLLTFVLLKRSIKATNFTSEAVHELIHVSWPNDKEVRIGTIVVIVTVVVAGLVLGVVDMGLTAAIRAALGA
jgi:preprotein translocase SecE subunit